MTGYYIEVGYLSGYSGVADTDEAWRILKAEAEFFCENPQKISAEAERLEAKLFAGPGERRDYETAYKERRDATIDFNEKEQMISQLASSGSGDHARKVKEHMRRAFCRLLIEEMHRRGIEVNMSVS